MNDKPSKDDPGSGAARFFQSMAKAMAENQRAWTAWLEQTASDGASKDQQRPQAGLAGAFVEAMARLRADPGKLMAAQLDLWNGYQRLWLEASQRMLGQETEVAVEPEPGDRRFRDPEWHENPFFHFIKQSYLLHSEWLKKTLLSAEGLDPDTAQKIDFFGRQVIDALAPTNFPLTNPTVLRETVETGGENLVRGFNNFLGDLELGAGRSAIRQTDMDAFEVGKNLGVTPGKVVYQNDLMQLIQYDPTTPQVFTRPLLIIPPWINKFYILDLRPENSFVKWVVDQGYTTFVVSWVNPDAGHADKGFDDYMSDGVLAALDAIERATGRRDSTVIGYCIGGTLLAATLAYMAATGDKRIKAATLLAAQVEFAEAGELRVFTDEAQIAAIEKQVSAKGYLDGASMAWTFNMLRANDLIWSFVINNYLLGRDPPAFDLLFWNADSTRLPARMLIEYLRTMYVKNLLVEPGGLELRGRPIDLRQVKTPVFIQASREDHIAPCRSVYKAMNIFGGPKRFVLAGSGHIAGVINPPAKQKYQHWINARRKRYADIDAWLGDATEQPGSWWPYWHQWNAAKSGAMVRARKPGDGKLPPIEDAPGSYVKVKS
ncbi:MAG: PHA/PHB synthase family protein [Kiloniellales bacterium]